jgi:hypothetical protein
LAFVREKTIKATFTAIDCLQKTGRVDHLRFDKGCIAENGTRRPSPLRQRLHQREAEMVGVYVDVGVEVVVVDWDKAGLRRELACLIRSSTRLLLQPFAST